VTKSSTQPELSDATVRRLRAGLSLPLLIGDRYAPRELVGRGGMGEVYRARDERLGRDVALKVLAAEATPGEHAERLRREARVLAQLDHPGIVPVHDSGALDDGRTFHVMRFVEGARLDEYASGGASRGDLLRALLRVAEAVAFAHGRGIVHRDLKPGNVMIGPFGEVLVLDWGIAQVAGDDDSPSAGMPGAGTPGFMAPEQRAGGIVDARADVYALGVMLRELLATGDAPIPKPLLAISTKATAPNSGERYQSAPEFAADIRHWLDGEGVLAYRENVTERLWRFARRHQIAILLLLGYALVRGAILYWRGI